MEVSRREMCVCVCVGLSTHIHTPTHARHVVIDRFHIVVIIVQLEKTKRKLVTDKVCAHCFMTHCQ